MTNIRTYRIEAGLTQAQLATILGVTQAAVAMWEAGERKPDIIMLKKISNALNVSADTLLEPITDSEQEETA